MRIFVEQVKVLFISEIKACNVCSSSTGLLSLFAFASCSCPFLSNENKKKYQFVLDILEIQDTKEPFFFMLTLFLIKPGAGFSYSLWYIRYLLFCDISYIFTAFYVKRETANISICNLTCMAQQNQPAKPCCMYSCYLRIFLQVQQSFPTFFSQLDVTI